MMEIKENNCKFYNSKLNKSLKWAFASDWTKPLSVYKYSSSL